MISQIARSLVALFAPQLELTHNHKLTQEGSTTHTFCAGTTNGEPDVRIDYNIDAACRRLTENAQIVLHVPLLLELCDRHRVDCNSTTVTSPAP